MDLCIYPGYASGPAEQVHSPVPESQGWFSVASLATMTGVARRANLKGSTGSGISRMLTIDEAKQPS